MRDPIRHLVADAVARSLASAAAPTVSGRGPDAAAALGAEAVRLARLAAAVHAGEAARPAPATDDRGRDAAAVVPRGPAPSVAGVPAAEVRP